MRIAATFLRTVTPLHVGTGQAVGPVDLPIARERSTHWPVIPGTSFKGVLRDAATQEIWGEFVRDARGVERTDEEIERECVMRLRDEFGTASDAGGDSYAGRFAVTDQRIVFFPVRSFHGTFAYVTCSLALHHLREALDLAGEGGPAVGNLRPAADVLVGPRSALLDDSRKVYFEDLDLTAGIDESGEVVGLGNFLETRLGLPAGMVADRLAVVGDTLFSFLTENATEVVTHVSLDYVTKTAREKFLRNEESVPAEAIFVGLATVLRGDEGPLRRIRAHASGLLQFGGKASVGQGLCRLAVVGGEA